MPKRYMLTKEDEVQTSAPEPPVFEAPPVEPVPAEPPVFEAPPVEPVPAEPSPEDALTKRLTDYVHHRLNQHLPSAVEIYVQELRDVIAGKTP